MPTTPPPNTPPASTPPTSGPRPSRRRAGRSVTTPDRTPLYVVAGLTDVVAAAVLENLQQTQERAARRLAELQNGPARLEQQAKQNADELGRRLRSVPGQVKAAPAVTRSRVSGLQRQLQGYRDEAVRTYGELAGRGRRAVDDTLVSARNLSARAERTAEGLRPTTTPTVTPRTAAARQAAAARANAGQTADERLLAERAAVRKVAAKRAAATRAANRRASQEAAARATDVAAGQDRGAPDDA